MDEITGGKGITFATGTPVSNSMTELYTIMRYLQYDTLMNMGMGHLIRGQQLLEKLLRQSNCHRKERAIVRKHGLPVSLIFR